MVKFGKSTIEDRIMKKWLKVLLKKGNINFEIYRLILNELKK